MEERKWYLYRHLKPSGEVFYIGIGQTKKFKRAYDKINRTKFWKDTTKKYTNYEVQVLATGLTEEEVNELEVILISWYGRKNLGLGTLVNLTDGGGGTSGHKHTEEWKKERSEAMLGKAKSIESREKLSLARKNMIFTEEHRSNLSKSRVGNNNNSKKIINSITLEVFISLREAAKSINREESTFRDYLKGRLKNKTNMMYLTEYIEQNPDFRHE